MPPDPRPPTILRPGRLIDPAGDGPILPVAGPTGQGPPACTALPGRAPDAAGGRLGDVVGEVAARAVQDPFDGAGRPGVPAGGETTEIGYQRLDHLVGQAVGAH